MNDKLTRWLSRINQIPSADDPEFEDYIEMLVESRIIEEVAS